MLWRGPTMLAAASIALALGIAGCGSGSPSTSGPESTANSTAGTASAKSAASAKAAADRPPAGASPALRAIHRQFPAPRPDPGVAGSAKAIEAGRRACAGKTPREVERAYFPVAVQRGGLDPASARAAMIARTGSYERHVATDAAFTAGQLAADAYEATLPASVGQFGYQGCAYALARSLERRLAPGSK